MCFDVLFVVARLLLIVFGVLVLICVVCLFVVLFRVCVLFSVLFPVLCLHVYTCYPLRTCFLPFFVFCLSMLLLRACLVLFCC